MAYERGIIIALTTVNTGIMVSIALMQITIGALIGTASTAATGAATAEGYRLAFGFIAVMALVTILIYSRVPDCKPRT